MAAKKRAMGKKVSKRSSAKDHKWRIVEEDSTPHFILELGRVWDNSTGLPPAKGDTAGDSHEATISNDEDGPRLAVGCHTFYSRGEADEHWRNDTGQDGDPRPLAKSLVRFVAEEFKKRGVKW